MTSVRVYLHNETSQTLVLASVGDHDGNWLGGGAVPAIAPGTVAMTGTKAEIGAIDVPFVGEVQLDGTECRLRYRGEYDENTTFMVHWNNAAVSSDASFGPGGAHVNKPQFHTNADEGSYSYWLAQGRADAVVHFYLRDARTVMTDFRPQNDGFLFKNSGWVDAPYTLPILEGTPFAFEVGNANTGLCGGMVYAALDYFLAGRRIPQDVMNPPESDPLFKLLVARLFDSFDLRSITLLYSLMAFGHDSDEAFTERLELPNRARVMAHEEWPQIMADIDSGRPSPITLMTVAGSGNPGDLGECHQVLVYGYEAHGHTVTMFVYDPNRPQDETIFMRFADGDVAHRIVVEHNTSIKDIYCFIRMNYNREAIRIPTEPRLTTKEIERRRLALGWEEPKHGEETAESGGERDYDIWPNCGTKRLPYTILRRSTSIGVTFTAVGFYDPVVEITVGGIAVPLQSLTDYTWPGQMVWQPAEPVPGEIGLGQTETRDIHFRADGGMRDEMNGGMTFHFRAEDGIFTVPVVLSCREQNETADSAWTWTYSYDVWGWREDTPGLMEARRDCFKRMVDTYRDGLHPVEEAAALIEQTLPGRRGNPLLDPDPDLVGVMAALTAQDPVTIETADAFSSLDTQQLDLIKEVQDLVKDLEATKIRPGLEEGPDLTQGIEDIVSGFDLRGPG